MISFLLRLWLVCSFVYVVLGGTIAIYSHECDGLYRFVELAIAAAVQSEPGGPA